jgi:hypothetical protein
VFIGPIVAAVLVAMLRAWESVVPEAHAKPG